MAHIKNVRIRLRPLTVCKHTNVKYYYEPDAYGHDTHIHAVDTDTMCGILFWWYSISMAMIPISMQLMLMPFPCPVVTVTDAHGTDAHAVDADAVCGIFWR